ncbi:claudin-10a isoform X4 [Syngnathus typhle]|uniref:claudin-10a isoform X4 n=1 Tax=Syngnathus typhle TaxID=161592 RepID=UPI002A69CA66|nr:claudin-10a isoform X4 [Syngnathus typhle]
MSTMATEIVAFLLSVSGWILVSSTLPTDYWKVSSVDGVSNCKDFPSMLALDAVCLGFFGAVLALLGMKCTKVGGSENIKTRLAVFAGFQYILSGLCCMTACSIYAHRITTDFFDPLFVAQKFELGAALFIGWAGSVLCILGGLIFCLSLSSGSSVRLHHSSRGAAVSPHTHGERGKATSSLQREFLKPSRKFGRNAYV